MTEVERDREDAEEQAYQSIGAAAMDDLARAGLCVQTSRFMGRAETLVQRAVELADDESETDAGERLDRLVEAVGELDD